MAFCRNCGAKLDDNAKFCSYCGTQAKNESFGDFAKRAANNFAEKMKDLNNNTDDTSAEYDSADIKENMLFAILAYIGILFIIPMCIAKESKYARFHANQGLVLFICEVIWGVITAITTIIFTFIGIFPFITILFNLANIAFFALMIVGIVNAATNKAKELPVIGSIRILK